MAPTDDDLPPNDDDDQDIDNLDDDTDDPDDDNPDDDPNWKPPTKGEWDRLQRRMKKLTGKPKASDVDRKLAEQLRGKGKKPADDTDDDTRDDGEAERWRGIAIQNAASAQIAAAGFSGTARQAARLARLIDTSDIQPNRDGSFDLEDEIEDLKEEYPQLFARQSGAGGRVPNVRTARNRGTGETKDPSQRTSDAMLKAAGYR